MQLTNIVSIYVFVCIHILLFMMFFLRETKKLKCAFLAAVLDKIINK